MKLLNALTIFGCFLVFACNPQVAREKQSTRQSIPTKKVNLELKNKPEEKKIEVWLDGSLFTNYMYPDEIAKPILYPLITSKGRVVTRGYPLDPKPGERADHPHHIGLWFNYGDVNGLDFWNNPGNPPAEKREKYGSIHHRSIEKIEQGTGFEVIMDWRGPGGQDLLVENTRFEFEQQGESRLITRTTTLTALGQKVDFKDNKEGMVAIRLTRSLELPSDKPAKFITTDGTPSAEKIIDSTPVTGNYLSSEGLEGNAVWGTRAEWMMLSGKVDNHPVSITIFDHPDNIGYPTYWHARGYGLFSANPLGQKVFSKGKESLNFSLEEKESITFKYRFLIKDGQFPTAEQLNLEFERFASRRHQE